MEVTSVSPSASSPTEWDDLCEIDVSNVAIHSVTLLISLCGLVGNGAVLWLISLKNVGSFIFILALVDFLFLLFTVPSAFLFLVEDVTCTPILPLLYLSFLFQLSLISHYWVLFCVILVGTTVCLELLCELCCRWTPPERLRWAVCGVQVWVVFVLFTVIPTVTFQCPSHHQEHCRAAVISVHAVILLLFVVPGVIFLTINFIQAKRGSKNRQLDTADIIFFIMMLFILLFSLFNLLQQLGYISLSSQVVFLLNCIQSSIKPFIYFLAGSSWRPCSVESLQLSLQRVFGEPEENTAHSNDAPKDTRV